jgi:hypothetical protein
MDDFLTPVQTTRNVRSNIEKFETLSLRDKEAKADVVPKGKPISEVSNQAENPAKRTALPKEDRSFPDEDSTAIDLSGTRSESKTSTSKPQIAHEKISSAEQVLAVLRAQPSDESVEAALEYLDDGIKAKHDFNIQVPSAAAAQILNVLVTTVIPDRWPGLNLNAPSKAEKASRLRLLTCMRSTAGIGTIVARVQSLVTSQQMRQLGPSQPIVLKDTISFFETLAHHNTLVRDLLTQTHHQNSSIGQLQAVQNEIISLLAGSKVLNMFQEACTTSQLKTEVPKWLQDPRDYNRWLSGNIVSASTAIARSDEETWKTLASFLKRAMSLGHKGRF